jgi:OOP family OmpA-OmpF porin
MKKTALAALVLAVLGAAPAMAQTTSGNWYLGLGAGVGDLDRSGVDLAPLANPQLDDTDTTYTVRGGYRFSPYFALELGYYDLGKYAFSGGVGSTTATGSVKAKSWGLSAVAIAPFTDAFDIYGRVGIAQSELKANAGVLGLTLDEQDKQTEATYAVGGRWNATKELGVFAEWMKNDKIKVDSYLFGVDFRF